MFSIQLTWSPDLTDFRGLFPNLFPISRSCAFLNLTQDNTHNQTQTVQQTYVFPLSGFTFVIKSSLPPFHVI